MTVPRNPNANVWKKIRSIIEDQKFQLVSVTFHKVTTGEERLMQFQPAKVVPSEGIQQNPNRNPDLIKVVQQNKKGEKGKPAKEQVRSFYCSTVSKIVADGKTYTFELK